MLSVFKLNQYSSPIHLDKAELFLFSLNDRPESNQPVTTKPTIMKFGGTSVEDSAAFRNVAHIVNSAAPERIVVVVSAIGGFTDALLSSVEQANDGDARTATRCLDQGFERHRAIANQLLGGETKAQFEAALADARDQIRELHKIVAAHPSTHAPLRDEIVAFGELLSSQLLCAVLRENGLAARYVDARCLIKTDESYGGGAPPGGNAAPAPTPPCPPARNAPHTGAPRRHPA